MDRENTDDAETEIETPTNTTNTVKSGRLFLTEREREIISGEADLSDVDEPIESYRRSVAGRIRDRYRRHLGAKGEGANDLDLLAEHMAPEYDEIVSLVGDHRRQHGAEWSGDLDYLPDPQAFDLDEHLTDDLDVLADQLPEQYDHLVDIVRQHARQSGADWRSALGFLADEQAFEMLVSQITQRHSGDLDNDDVHEVLNLFREQVEQVTPDDDSDD